MPVTKEIFKRALSETCSQRVAAWRRACELANIKCARFAPHVDYTDGSPYMKEIVRLLGNSCADAAILLESVGDDGVIHLEGAHHENISLDLARADLASMEGASLRYINGEMICLTFADIRSVDFSFGCLQRADFRASRLGGAKFDCATLYLANFHGVNGVCASFRSADLREADFSYADLRGANFMGAVLNNVKFAHTNLKDAMFDGAIMNAGFVTIETILSLTGKDQADEIHRAFLQEQEEGFRLR